MFYRGVIGGFETTKWSTGGSFGVAPIMMFGPDCADPDGFPHEQLGSAVGKITRNLNHKQSCRLVACGLWDYLRDFDYRHNGLPKSGRSKNNLPSLVIDGLFLIACD